jgi:ATP-dependent Clp protease adaptor protein ClpS
MKNFQVSNKYSLFILKDNFTSKEFVKKILTFIFDKTDLEAEDITEKIWLTGKAYVASYIKEIALVKKTQVERNAKNYGFPLKIILEEVSL